jgi:hypothetical protein
VRAGRGAHDRIRLTWRTPDTSSPWVTLWATLGRDTLILRRRAQRGSLLLALRAPRRPFTLRVRVLDTSANSVLAVRRVP